VSDPLERLPIPAFLRRHSSVATFLGGFLFDLATMQRIDAWMDLALQMLYLVALAALLVGQQRHETGRWIPSERVSPWWAYNVEALHFLYGALLSAYVVLYVRSSTGSRSVVFLVLLVGVMIVNEIPLARRASHRLRLGLFGFCVASFLIYFVPIVIGRLGAWVFMLSLAIAAGVVWLLATLLRTPGAPRADRIRLFTPALGVLALIAALYTLKLIPPIPLSVQFQGIYHDVRREGNAFTLVYSRPTGWMLWRRDSRPFARRNGDRLHYFARVFAPAGFSQQLVLKWEVLDPRTRAWSITDRIPLSITGGRAEGFRGTAVKANFSAGTWRVTAETDDARALATIVFRVEDDGGQGERSWHVRRS